MNAALLICGYLMAERRFLESACVGSRALSIAFSTSSHAGCPHQSVALVFQGLYSRKQLTYGVNSFKPALWSVVPADNNIGFVRTYRSIISRKVPIDWPHVILLMHYPCEF